MRKHYNSSNNKILRDNRATSDSGSINNIIKSDNSGIEKLYISEQYNYKNDIKQKTPENISYNVKEEAYKRIEIQKKEEQNKEIQNRSKEYYNKNSYQEQDKRATLYDGEIDLDRVKSYTSPKYKLPSYKNYEAEQNKSLDNNDYRYESQKIDNLKRHDTDFVSKGMDTLFIKDKINQKDMIYTENRDVDNNISKIMNKDKVNITTGKAIGRENKSRRKEGRNEEENRDTETNHQNISNRTLQNKYIRSRFAENMGQNDEEFSISVSKSGVVSAEKGLKLGSNLGRYTSVRAINIFRKEKINNTSLRSTLKRSAKDSIINFKGGTSDDLGIETAVKLKDKTVQTKRLITDRKGFIKNSIDKFDLERNEDLGLKSIVQTKNASVMSTRVLKGIYGTTKTTAKTAKRTYQIGSRVTQSIIYNLRSLGKNFSNPMVLNGIIGIFTPFILVLLMIFAITAIFPSSTAVSSYPIAEIEVIEELQRNINIWNEEVNNNIQNYYKEFDHVVMENDDSVMVSLNSVLALLAVEKEQNIGLEDLERAKDIYNYFFTLENRKEIYEVVETIKDDFSGITETKSIEKTRIIVNLNNLDFEEAIEGLDYSLSDKEWAISLYMSDLTEMYPDLVVNNEKYYPNNSDGITQEEIQNSGGRFIHPTNNVGVNTSPFGYRIHPIFGTNKLHTGMDIGGNNLAKIYAVQNGTITHAGWLGSYGNAVKIDHGNGLVTLYAHCSSISVRKGQNVNKGDHISNVGSTGNSTGPHLHFEVRINGKFFNPINFLK